MLNNIKVVCIIPARLKSTRFPEKILHKINNKPLIQYTWDAAKKINIFSDVIIAIDSEKTANIIKNFNGKYIFTSAKCKSGTKRIIEIMHSGKVNADIWVNWQADEPFIQNEMINDLLSSIQKNIIQVWTLKKRIKNENEINSPNNVKVVCNNNNYALYFSRSVIPYYREQSKSKIFYKHVGLYAYTTKALQQIAQISNSYLENAEKLEQLSFLENQIPIKVNDTLFQTTGIDTQQDLAAF